MIKTFILYNELEINRHILVANLKTCFQEHEVIKSIYPKQIHVSKSPSHQDGRRPAHGRRVRRVRP